MQDVEQTLTGDPGFGRYAYMTFIFQFLLTWSAGFILWSMLCCFVALPTWWLWNWLVPEIFGLPEIGFFQALGLLLLCGLIFGHKKVEISPADA